MPFTFKQFQIHQNQCAMKVGTDGVLLGAWANGGKRILDIGTGTGLIALMMAQRNPNAHIDAIDIDPDAIHQATQNIRHSPFANRITPIHTPLQTHTPQATYDAIVSNPPYFINSLKSNNPQRNTARHADTLPPTQLLRSARPLLSPTGTLSLIIPAELSNTIQTEATLQGYTLSRHLILRTKPHKPPFRHLLEFRLHPATTPPSPNTTLPHPTPSTTITQTEIHTETLLLPDGTRSQWYATLTQDFYIK